MLPPTFRFLAELITWTFLILAGYWYLTILSMLMFALINFNGDKKPKDTQMAGIYVPGWVRILLELGFGILGIVVSYLYLENLWALLPLVIILFSFVLDHKRWLWMLGKLENPPEYVTAVHTQSKG